VLKRAGLSTECVERYLSSKHIATEEQSAGGSAFRRSATDALARAEPEPQYLLTRFSRGDLTLALLAEERGDAATCSRQFILTVTIRGRLFYMS